MKNVLPVLLVVAAVGVAVAVWWIGKAPSTEPQPGAAKATEATGATGPSVPGDVDTESPPLTVNGTALDAETGTPTAIDDIHGIPVGTDPTLVWGHARDDGRLRLQPFPRGTYDLVAYRLPDRIGLVHGLDVRERPVTGLEIVMRRGGTLRFHITDRRRIRPQAPLDTAYRIYLEQDGKTASSRGVLHKARPDRADGTFDITAPPGRVHVFLTDHRGEAWTHEQVVDVKPGEVTPVRFTLE